jgi:DNA-binding response OmpR family regulator
MAVVGDRRALAAQDVPTRPVRVLVVGSDAGARATTSRALSEAGFEVGEASTAAAALASAREDRFDLVVLDAVLRDVSGVDALRTLREHADVPVIVISPKDSDIERVLYLELGADDCVTTPFSLLELVSRARAVLRRDRREARTSSLYTVGALAVDIARREVSLGGRPIAVTPSEFEILALLSRKPGHVFGRREIMQHLWAGPYFGDGHASDMHILNLRRKLEADPARPVRLLTARAVGYKLVAPADER